MAWGPTPSQARHAPPLYPPLQQVSQNLIQNDPEMQSQSSALPEDSTAPHPEDGMTPSQCYAELSEQIKEVRQQQVCRSGLLRRQ